MNVTLSGDRSSRRPRGSRLRRLAGVVLHPGRRSRQRAEAYAAEERDLADALESVVERSRP